MFGQEARLPVDVCFGTSPDGTKDACHTRYVAKLKKSWKQACKVASEATDKRPQGYLSLTGVGSVGSGA